MGMHTVISIRTKQRRLAGYSVTYYSVNVTWYLAGADPEGGGALGAEAPPLQPRIHTEHMATL